MPVRFVNCLSIAACRASLSVVNGEEVAGVVAEMVELCAMPPATLLPLSECSVAGFPTLLLLTFGYEWAVSEKLMPHWSALGNLDQ